jgi:hypothetical protein
MLLTPCAFFGAQGTFGSQPIKCAGIAPNQPVQIALPPVWTSGDSSQSYWIIWCCDMIRTTIGALFCWPAPSSVALSPQAKEWIEKASSNRTTVNLPDSRQGVYNVAGPGHDQRHIDCCRSTRHKWSARTFPDDWFRSILQMVASSKYHSPPGLDQTAGHRSRLSPLAHKPHAATHRPLPPKPHSLHPAGVTPRRSGDLPLP